MNVTVKNIPDRVHRVIKRAAEQQGRSLNAQIIRVLETEAADVERRKRMRDSRKVLERFVASLPPLGDSAPLIREDRER